MFQTSSPGNVIPDRSESIEGLRSVWFPRKLANFELVRTGQPTDEQNPLMKAVVRGQLFLVRFLVQTRPKGLVICTLLFL